jgi:hypothetical protein
MTKLKMGGDLTYLPLRWLGLGGRFDLVQPDLADSGRSFSVGTARLLLRTAFLTREQVVLQVSRYWYGAAYAPGNPLGGAGYPYDGRAVPPSAALGADRNALQLAGIIWF